MSTVNLTINDKAVAVEAGSTILEAAEKLKEKNEAEEAPAAGELTAKIEEMISRRLEAKRARDFATADSIRCELSAMGVDIVDTPDGTKYTIR